MAKIGAVSKRKTIQIVKSLFLNEQTDLFCYYCHHCTHFQWLKILHNAIISIIYSSYFGRKTNHS